MAMPNSSALLQATSIWTGCFHLQRGTTAIVGCSVNPASDALSQLLEYTVDDP